MKFAIFTFLLGLGIGSHGGIIIDLVSDQWRRVRRSGPRDYFNPCDEQCRMPK